MAKKKSIKPEEEEEEEISDLDDIDSLDDDTVFPDIKKEPSEAEKTPSIDGEYEEEEEEEDYEEDYEEELQVIQKDYKLVKPSIVKGENENDYEMFVEGQSHGFCNLLVKHLLKTEGVNIAAYKITKIESPKIFIRVNEGFDVKDIVRNGMSSLHKEVKSVEKAFQKLV
ncbi:MAG: RpoL/Rpb11 RNA polymerase subunit family protein [Promethearchaeota archaeon]